MVADLEWRGELVGCDPEVAVKYYIMSLHNFRNPVSAILHTHRQRAFYGHLGVSDRYSRNLLLTNLNGPQTSIICLISHLSF